jgi:hypothetical protein
VTRKGTPGSAARLHGGASRSRGCP